MTQPLIRIAQIEQDELTLVIRTVIQTSVPLDDLFDVDVATATEGQILEYGGSPIGWRAVANSGGGLGDVVLGSPITKGDFLVYQGSPSIWVNTSTISLQDGRVVINGVSSTGSPSVDNNSTLEVSSTLPGILLNDTDGPSNEKAWRFIVSGGDLIGEMRSDSGTSSNRWLEVIRSGVLASEFSLFVGAEETAIRAIDGGAVQLYHNDINVTETTTAAAGGLRVNNTITGAGFERVLTLSDLGGGGGGGTNVVAGQALFYTGSPESIINVGAGDGLQIIGSPKSIAVDSTVFRTTNNLSDIADVNAGSPTLGAILYNDGANWVKLARGTSDQVLTMGSPLLPVWKNNTGGSPADQLHVTGGDGITTTYGSPEVTVAVDATVARISIGSPGLINTGTLIVDTIDLGTRSTITTYETTTVSISQAAVATYAITNYRSAELLVEAVQGNNYHVTKFLTTHDGTNAVSTEYGTVTTPEFFGSPGIGSPAISGEQATYTVDISGGNLRLLATPKTASSTVFTTTATLIKVKT